MLYALCSMRVLWMERFFCSNCNRFYPLQPSRWRCDCSSFLDLEFESKFPIKKILKRSPTLWRYRETIPIHRETSILSMGEGFTPLQEIELDGSRTFVKIDYLFPTGSYKDRGATVLMSKMKEWGVREVVEDSSGNAGSAIAASSNLSSMRLSSSTKNSRCEDAAVMRSCMSP